MPQIDLDEAALRRALLFLAAIAGPLCIGVWAGSPAGALIGSVTGLLLSFADDEGALPRRLSILAMNAAALGVGGALGTVLHGFPWPVWVLFALATFAAGQALRFGKGPAMAARHVAMALAVASGGPEFTPALLWYPLAALLIVVVARLIDHAVAGPLKQQRAAAAAGPVSHSLMPAPRRPACGSVSTSIPSGRSGWSSRPWSSCNRMRGSAMCGSCTGSPVP